jgi:Flp pilus assembly protein TadG
MNDAVQQPRLQGDDGGALIEVALVLPLVLTLLMVVLDFGLLELKQSQLTSAARDGARAGIISWQDANAGTYSGGACPSTPTSFAGICTAARKRLAGSTATSLTVRCYKGTTTTEVACSSSVASPGQDTMLVTMTYTYSPFSAVGQTFLGTTKSFTSTARMVIQ